MICNCGSGFEAEQVFDARGIFVTNVCDQCRKEKLSKYRPDIFTDSGYLTDEPVEEDDLYGAGEDW